MLSIYIFYKNTILSLLSIILFVPAVFGQLDYFPLQSQGTLPEEFTSLSIEKYEKDRAKIDQGDKASTRDAQDEFYLKSNYQIDQMFRSGKVLFNDSISNYLNRIKNEILRDDPALRNKIRIYVTRSASVNAFATNSGAILVNLGLISQLETESQLAFVLCHEIVHVKKEHTINEYVETKKIQRGKEEYQGLSANDKELAVCKYSRETESEADLEGLELFRKTSYSHQSLIHVFHTLQYAKLPFANTPFDKSFFNTEFIKIPTSYFIDTIDSIKEDALTDYSHSSHPDPKKRYKAIERRLKIAGDSLAIHKSDFLVSQSDFFWCRKKARYEICRLLLMNREYNKLIYHTYLLLKEEPDSKFLRKMIAKGMYYISRYHTGDKFHRIHDNEESIEGESQQVYHLFQLIPSKELSALTTAYLWRLRTLYPKDEEIRLMSEDIMCVMIENHYDKLSYFYREGLSQRDTSNEQKDTYKYIRFVFVENFLNPDFENTFNSYVDKKNIRINRSIEQVVADRKLKAKEQKAIRRNKYYLGIDRIVMIDPFYARINTTKKQAMRFQYTERRKLELINLLKINGEKSGVQTVILSPIVMNADELQAMNDFSLMEDWIHERLEHMGEMDSVYLVSPFHNEVQLIASRYGTSNFVWPGSVWYSEKNQKAKYLFGISLAWPFMLPIAIYKTITPKHYTLHYTMLFDVSSGIEKMHRVRLYNGRDKMRKASFRFARAFKQIKRSPKR